MVTTKECAPFNFTCTTLYGCEVAAMGKNHGNVLERNKKLVLETRGKDERMDMPGVERRVGYCTEGGGEGGG